MLLIDRRGQRVRPVCRGCRKLSAESLRPKSGQVYVCKICLRKPSLTVEIVEPEIRRAS